MNNQTIYEPCNPFCNCRKKIIFNLMKKKAVEEKKAYKSEREGKVKETYTIISSIENFYADRMALLKERLAEEKMNRRESE
jgi:hypothetical protein